MTCPHFRAIRAFRHSPMSACAWVWVAAPGSPLRPHCCGTIHKPSREFGNEETYQGPFLEHSKTTCTSKPNASAGCKSRMLHALRCAPSCALERLLALAAELRPSNRHSDLRIRDSESRVERIPRGHGSVRRSFASWFVIRVVAGDKSRNCQGNAQQLADSPNLAPNHKPMN